MSAVETQAVPGSGPPSPDRQQKMPTLRGHFAVFNEWAEIESVADGRFLERIAPGAFAKTIAERRDKIKVLFQHGRDPSIGGKPLGTPTVLREDERGVWFEVALFDTSYVRELLPGLRAGAYGASFRFQTIHDNIDRSPRASRYNPQAIPERTIREAKVFEFGPVTFGAYDGATASARSRQRAEQLELVPFGAEEVETAELLRAVSENRCRAWR
jgi:HK97 family phage prohead protease